MMPTSFHILGVSIALAIIIPTNALASENQQFDCNVQGMVRVTLISEEGRAQIVTPRGTFFALGQEDGSYANFDEAIQFFTHENSSTLWFGSEQFECLTMVELEQNHDTGSVGGNEIYNIDTIGRSLGGKLRDGPGINFSQIGSLAEGTWITILTDTGVRYDGYNWFEIALNNGSKGYQWGGIMCSNGDLLAGVYQVCN